MTPERARKIAQACADSWYGGASGLNLKEAITQGILEACQETESDLVATRAERDAYRKELAAARAELRLQNEANDMIAKERDAFEQARNEARLLFNKEYNEANESRRRLRDEINQMRAEVLQLSKRLLSALEDERKWCDRYYSLWAEACDKVDVSSRKVFGEWAKEVDLYYQDAALAGQRREGEG